MTAKVIGGLSLFLITLGAAAQTSGIQIFRLPSTNATSEWIKLGTYNASQQGYDIDVKIVTSNGFNADIAQDQVSHIHFKSSNADSVDANGFAGDSWWYQTGPTAIAPSQVVWVANAAGTAATNFTLFAYFGAWNGDGSYYVVDAPPGTTWTNSATGAQTNPGSGSSTVLVAQNQFYVGSNSSFAGNVGIGTTSPKSLIHGYQTGTNAVGLMQSAVQGAYWSVLTPTTATNVYRGFVGGDGTSNHFLVGQYANSSEDMIGFYTGTSLNERMRIMNSGNVGVGTSAPAYKLDVNGTIHSSGGIVFPDGTIQTSALSSGGQALTVANTSAGGINVTLNAASSIPVINFTRWTGTGAIQHNASVGQFFNSTTNEYDFGIGTGISTTGNQAATTNAVVVTLAGDVGIGTTASNAKLEVNGNIKLTAGTGSSMTYTDGTVQSTAWTGVLTGGDYAESVNVSGIRSGYEPGDVLVIDPDSEGKFVKSSTPYATTVTGIYSTKPGVTGRRQHMAQEHMKEEVPMAMTGIVPTKVSAENGPIRAGDLLVTSSQPGYAMKGTDRGQMLGAVIGKAIGHLDSGTGVIEAVVTLQ